MMEATAEEIGSYFPILAEITDTGEQQVFQDPKDIPSGVAIRVLETNYDPITLEVWHCRSCGIDYDMPERENEDDFSCQECGSKETEFLEIRQK